VQRTSSRGAGPGLMRGGDLIRMRFYANGEYLFSISDPTISNGLLGVFARASGEDMVSVSFYEFSVYETLGAVCINLQDFGTYLHNCFLCWTTV
jgi:hypothetical protein